MEITSGSIVLATRGRDTGRYFLVAKREGDYLYLVDGKTRKVANPKKKKVKHVAQTEAKCEGIGEKFERGKTVFDSEVYSALKSLNLEKEER